MDKKIPLLYRDIIADISYDSLPSDWTNINLSSFSEKKLFDYQQDAVSSVIKLLYYYFETLLKYEKEETTTFKSDPQLERKKKLYNELRKYDMELLDSLEINDKRDKILFSKLKNYYQTSESNGIERIPFINFVNRMSLWMATGSGKTLVIIKIIEVLNKLIDSGKIPNNDILILTHRDYLVEQINKLVSEYNQYTSKKIKVWDIKKYGAVKEGSVLTFKDEINIFIYRSDLIADETKEKLLGFEDIENNGRWYLLLDEAHKGDKEDSKRQKYYSVITRNGFLFNFSATFTDPWDIITTVYEFNLNTFIEKGYGKNVYLSQQEFNAFKGKEDFDTKNKQKVVLKSLILLTLSKISKLQIESSINMGCYHNPMMVALVHSVNVEDSDLELFFLELEKIAKGKIDKTLFTEAKEEIIKELGDHPKYIFGSESIDFVEAELNSIEVSTILEKVFNAQSFGTIEVLKIPQNNKELIFKLKTSVKPFALIKIGDISNWIKEKLVGYEINESYDESSYFAQINENTNFINILMGSREFYEGWDSPRPNVMIFINIGTGNAKKYINQSIGRGIRIKPFKDKIKRINTLRKEDNLLAKEAYAKVAHHYISLIETLFIFGTHKGNLEDILASTKYEREADGEILNLDENEFARDKVLLVPTYVKKNAVDISELPRFKANKKLLSSYLDWIDNDIILYNLFFDKEMNPETINRVRAFVASDNFSDTDDQNPNHQLSKLIDHVNIALQDIDKFVQLTNEIVHFKRIKVSLGERELEELKGLIEKVKKYKNPEQEEASIRKAFAEGKIDLEKYTSLIKELSKLSNEEQFTHKEATLKIKHIINHYFVPIILSDMDKVDYINHIINVESERKFIMELERILHNPSNPFAIFDWWMFSKLDQYLDEIYIPYYNRDSNKIERFIPDFIFWLKKGNNYFISFIDPKGTKHTDYQYKVDGYKEIYEHNKDKKKFKQDRLDIEVSLALYTSDLNKLAEGYKRYWFDSLEKHINNLYKP